ncbi:MAG: triose-phosphate isomerase [Euryarchaeota archaeon]|nr:triose-phosphate isomerase [Euryarchaeota archaeon]
MAVETPVIVINYKAYPESIGPAALELSKLADALAREKRASVVVCPPVSDLFCVQAEVGIPVWGQAADAVEPGGRTGHVTCEMLVNAGAEGLLVNHSERRLQLADMEWLVARARRLKLDTCVCTNNVAVSRAAAALGPDFVAVEPPELIGGDVSVTTADPEVVRRSVEEVRRVDPKVRVLCGAGVKNGKDVSKAIELGAQGVLLASGVVKAKDKRATLLDLIAGLK